MRLIDADALIDFLDVGHLRHPSELCFSEVEVANLLLHAPTLSTDEVRGVGEWITDRTWEHDGEPYCSVCDFEQSFARFQKFKFCPNCGARMKGAEDGTTDNT